MATTGSAGRGKSPGDGVVIGSRHLEPFPGSLIRRRTARRALTAPGTSGPPRPPHGPSAITGKVKGGFCTSNMRCQGFQTEAFIREESEALATVRRALAPPNGRRHGTVRRWRPPAGVVLGETSDLAAFAASVRSPSPMYSHGNHILN